MPDARMTNSEPKQANIFKKIDRILLPEKTQNKGIIYFVLLYLTLFWSPFFYAPSSSLDWSVSIVGNLLFLVCYFRLYWVARKYVGFYISVIVLIGCALSFISAGASTFFIYGASFACMCKTHKRSVMVIVLINLIILGLVLLLERSWYFGGPAMFFSMMVGGMNIYQDQIRIQNKLLLDSQEHVQHLAQLAERERIGRDLHDMLGHTLSVITLKAELASKLIDKNADLDRVKQEIKQVESLSRDTLAQVRDAIKGYRDTTVEHEARQGQVAALAANIDIKISLEPLALTKQVNAQLGLVVREAVTNIIRHADTNNAHIALKTVNNKIVLTIENQGELKAGPENTGMASMRDRINSLGGTMEVIKQPNTVLRFCCPIQLHLKDA
jgi:two-component system, NarL family, sensor histidine kinase DesK